MDALVRSAVDAFFDQGLLAASRQLLETSMGSFGLVISHSLDADGELVASRGQTMSIAFYPEHGMVMFGSESAATEPGMTLPSGSGGGMTSGVTDEAAVSGKGGIHASVRLDMDDVNGEVVQLVGSGLRDGAPALRDLGHDQDLELQGRDGVPSTLLMWSHVEGRIAKPKPLLKRVLHLAGSRSCILPPMAAGWSLMTSPTSPEC